MFQFVALHLTAQQIQWSKYLNLYKKSCRRNVFLTSILYIYGKWKWNAIKRQRKKKTKWNSFEIHGSTIKWNELRMEMKATKKRKHIHVFLCWTKWKERTIIVTKSTIWTEIFKVRRNIAPKKNKHIMLQSKLSYYFLLYNIHILSHKRITNKQNNIRPQMYCSTYDNGNTKTCTDTQNFWFGFFDVFVPVDTNSLNLWG